jgi:cytochrome P450
MLVEGASDTTPSAMHWLVIMLTAFPDAQRRLHDEVDRVVGRERVPRPDDFERLPYLQASYSPGGGCGRSQTRGRLASRRPTG